MLERHPRLYLMDILESGAAIQDYVRGVGLAQFMVDRMRTAAVIREFEIIGEAVGKLSEDLKARRPQIPWQNIKDFRNLLIHEYFGVDFEIVWGVIQEELPLLLDAAQTLLHELSEGS